MTRTYAVGVTRTDRYGGRMQWWTVVGVILVLVVVAGVVHLALTFANRRGWVWYRNKDRPPPRSLGMLEEVYQPSIEHVIDAEAKDDSEADHEASGDPEEPGQTDA
ncbi:MAG: hypothetical protein ACR2N2_08055 [Acidimicrobiia bacterium]